MTIISKLFPLSEHRYCVRHIQTNLGKTFKGKALKDHIWACAKPTHLHACEKEM